MKYKKKVKQTEWERFSRNIEHREQEGTIKEAGCKSRTSNSEKEKNTTVKMWGVIDIVYLEIDRINT